MDEKPMQDTDREHKFNRRTTTTPQPENYPLANRTPTTGDVRTDLCDLRTKLWRISQSEAATLTPIKAEIRTALDALNLSIAKLVVKDMDRVVKE